MTQESRARVAVGISGGVDSAMAAKILLDEGYAVIGVTMSIWDDSIPIHESTKSGCFGPGEKEDLESAAEICARLGIPHHIIKLQDEYRSNVLAYYCDTYLQGKTPNPCLMCNKRMKFGFLPQKVREAGIQFDLFATGHYVQVDYNATTGRYQLQQALDGSKDQSYFLSFLGQDQLKDLLFPLGRKSKAEIKAYAREVGFAHLADKQESQDFLESDDYSVLFEKGSFKSGDIVDVSGNVIGTHNGVINYTIGQRKNLGISGRPEPYYVLEIDSVQNRIVVGPMKHLYSNQCIATDINWVSINPVIDRTHVTAKIRAQHTPASCAISPLPDNKLHVLFQDDQLSVTPGQGIVFYNGSTVLAGGIIGTA